MSKSSYRVRKCKLANRPHLKALVAWKDEAGKEKLKFFASGKEAETWARQRETELLNQGREVLSFPSWLRVMAQDCHARLSPYEKTINDATAFLLAHLKQQAASLSIAEAFALYLDVKRRLRVSADHLRNLKTLGKKFAEAHEGLRVSEITARHAEGWLHKLPGEPITKNHQAKGLSAFFTWSVTQGYAAANPWQGVALFKEKDTPVGILTVDQLEALLKAATPQVLAYAAIGAFAGLRCAEICRLDWSEVDFEDGFIEVTAAKSKTSQRRLVKIQPVLAAWLRPVAQESGPVVTAPTIIHLRIAELCQRAEIGAWPKNALRHSFASYHLAHFKNAAELALEMGHAGTAMIFGHYRQLVREFDAARFWNLHPAEPARVLDLALGNTPDMRFANLRARDPLTNRFQPVTAGGYQKTVAEYAVEYAVTPQCIARWIHKGRPLDDREAMSKLERREYERTAAEYASTYKVSVARVKHWIAAGWPLDNPEAVQRYLDRCKDVADIRETKKTDGAKIVRIDAGTTPKELKTAQAGH